MRPPSELIDLQKQFDDRRAAIDAEFDDARKKAPREYLAALNDLEIGYTKAGDLRALLTVRSVRTAFEANPDMSAVVPEPAPAPPPLQKVQQDHLNSFLALHARQQERLAELHRSFLAHLEALKRLLTQQNRIEEAIVVMEFAESAQQNLSASAVARPPPPPIPPLSPASTPPSVNPAVVRRPIEGHSRGRIERWNPATADISVQYNFATESEVHDWTNAQWIRPERKVTVTDSVMWLDLSFADIEEIEFDVWRLAGEGPITAQIENNLFVEIGMSAPKGKRLYQINPDFPIIQSAEEIANNTAYRVKLKFAAGRVLWSVNDVLMGHRPLDRALRFPARIGLGSQGSTSAFNRVRVIGTLQRD